VLVLRPVPDRIFSRQTLSAAAASSRISTVTPAMAPSPPPF
jgi:hypothetical protein